MTEADGLDRVDNNEPAPNRRPTLRANAARRRHERRQAIVESEIAEPERVVTSDQDTKQPETERVVVADSYAKQPKLRDRVSRGSDPPQFRVEKYPHQELRYVTPFLRPDPPPPLGMVHDAEVTEPKRIVVTNNRTAKQPGIKEHVTKESGAPQYRAKDTPHFEVRYVRPFRRSNPPPQPGRVIDTTSPGDTLLDDEEHIFVRPPPLPFSVRHSRSRSRSPPLGEVTRRRSRYARSRSPKSPRPHPGRSRSVSAISYHPIIGDEILKSPSYGVRKKVSLNGEDVERGTRAHLAPTTARSTPRRYACKYIPSPESRTLSPSDEISSSRRSWVKPLRINNTKDRNSFLSDTDSPDYPPYIDRPWSTIIKGCLTAQILLLLAQLACVSAAWRIYDTKVQTPGYPRRL